MPIPDVEVRTLWNLGLYSYEQKWSACLIAASLHKYCGRGVLLLCEPPANASKKS